MSLFSRRHLMFGSAALAVFPMTAIAQASPLAVTATFSILADFVREVGGDRIALTTLVSADTDAHAYQPASRDLKALGDAKLVISNGFGFEPWLERMKKASNSKADFVEATAKIEPLPEKMTAGHGHSHGHSHGQGKHGQGKMARDPHAWQSVSNARAYVVDIRDALTKNDPAGSEHYATRAARYDKELEALDAEIRATIARWPAKNRRIISSHDAFQYFEKAYGLTFFAPRGMSSADEANTRQMARLIDQIRKEKIPAVFIEQLSDQKLMDRIAKETGAIVGGRLYADSLSASDGPAATYISMMRHNIRVLDKALAASS